MVENIEISKSIIERAKIVSSKIDDEEIRKRVFALNIAANVTAEHLNSIGFDVDTNLSLYRISSFAKSLELADIYIDGIRLDVRVSFDGQLFAVPKIQEKFDANPEAYIVVHFTKDLDSVDVLGYIPNAELTLTETNSEYRFYETSILKPIEELKDFLASVEVKRNIYSVVEHEKIKELTAAFIDDEISESEKVYFIKHVISCPVCRETFCSVCDFDSIVAHVQNYEELLNDSTLSVLSGNKTEVDMVALANMAYVENAEEVVDEQVLLEEVATEQAVEEDIVDDLAELAEFETEEKSSTEMEDDEKDLGEERLLEDYIVAEKVVEDENVLLGEELSLSSEELEIEDEKSVDNILLDEEFENSDFITEQNVEETQTTDVQEFVIEDEIENKDEFVLIAEDNNVHKNFDDELSLENEDDMLHEIVSLGDDELVLQEDDDNLLLDGDIDVFEHKEIEETDGKIFDIEHENISEETFLEVANSVDDNMEIQEELALDDNNIVNVEEVKDLEEGFEDFEQEENIVTEEEQEEESSFELEDNNWDIQEEISDNRELEESFEPNENQETIDDNNNLDVSEEEKSEIEQLLDDDLLALLSETNENVENSSEVKTVVEQAEEDVHQKNGDSENEETNEQIVENEDIDSLYENSQVTDTKEKDEFQLAEEPLSEKTVNATKKIVVLIALLLLLGGGVATFLFNNKMKNNTSENIASDEEFFDMQKNKMGIDNDSPAVSQDINRSMINSFSDKPTAITITKLSWQVNEKLAAEDSVKEYLQIAGKNIQMNLQDDLMNSADLNFNNLVKVSMEIAQDNTLKGIQVLESSGSDQVDDIIVRSLTNTLKYVSVPKIQNFNSDYFLTLIINF